MWAFLAVMNIVYRASATSAVSPQRPSTAAVTTPWAYGSDHLPEIDYDKVDKVRGMEITVVTTARSDDQAAKLLQLLGMPFRKD